MRNFVMKLVMMLAIMVPSVASAQWTQGINPDNNGTPFWDNRSTDGTNCNVGYALRGIAGTTGNLCNNERPSSTLPVTSGDVLFSTDFYHATPGYSLFTNTATIKLFGDVAGQNRDWGWYTGNTFTSLNGLATQTPLLIGNTTGWGLWMSLTDGNRAVSTGNQFAFFAEDTNIDNTFNDGSLRFGIEDVNVRQGGGSDRDYNDVMGRLDFTGGSLETTVPEPSTYVLMASGLFGLGVVSRRRKNAVKA